MNIPKLNDASDIEIRPIRREYMNEVIELLQLISPFKPEYSEHDAIWRLYETQSNIFAVVAFIGPKLVGFGSVMIEMKLRGVKVGHIEEVVTHSAFRRHGVGHVIVEFLTDIAREKGCYKTVLACERSVSSFYKDMSFESNGISMKRLT